MVSKIVAPNLPQHNLTASFQMVEQNTGLVLQSRWDFMTTSLGMGPIQRSVAQFIVESMLIFPNYRRLKRGGA